MTDTRFPPIYPHTFHNSRNFVGKASPIEAPRLLPDLFKLHGGSALLRGRLLGELDRVMVERSGVLFGDYAVLPERQILLDRYGTVISINYPWEYAPLPGRLWETINIPEFWLLKNNVLEAWDELTVAQGCAVVGHAYVGNYYHFSHEAVQVLRLTQSFGAKQLVGGNTFLAHGFQQDLVSRAIGERKLMCHQEIMRVRDPVIGQAHQSFAGLQWLRELLKPDFRPGSKRYYIRRTPRTFRKSSNISETPEFMAFLSRHGFQTIDFGNGERSITDQIRMMDGAGVILTAHGAGLTNIGYLSPPVKVIEVFGRHVMSTSFLQIAAMLGLEYHGVICETADELEQMIVDVPQLAAIVEGEL